MYGKKRKEKKEKRRKEKKGKTREVVVWGGAGQGAVQCSEVGVGVWAWGVLYA